jgi:hypothetical protein
VLCEVSAYITDLNTLYYLLLTFSFMTIGIIHFNIVSGMCTSIIMPNVCVSGCHTYLRFFDTPPEDDNLIAGTYVAVTNILC